MHAFREGGGNEICRGYYLKREGDFLPFWDKKVWLQGISDKFEWDQIFMGLRKSSKTKKKERRQKF